MATSSVTLGSSNLPLRDPQATCDSCGALGTVGRAVRVDEHGAPLELHCFCRACWPSARTRFLARNDEAMRRAREKLLADPHAPIDASNGFEIGGASWHGVLELVRDVQATLEHVPHRPSSQQLAMMCDRWPELEREFEEPMPPEVRAFYNAHRSGAS